MGDEDKLIRDSQPKEKEDGETGEKHEDSSLLNSPEEREAVDKQANSKTLPRGYPCGAGGGGGAKSRGRAPRAQSDPTCSAKVEKKTVSASTQDNLGKKISFTPIAVKREMWKDIVQTIV